MSEDSRKKLFSGGQGMQQDFDVFNSLLARGRGQNVRDRNKALILTGLTAVFQGKQRKLQQKLLDNLANLDETFKTEQESRRTIYNKENENRDFYDKYKADPSKGIRDYAKFLYNNDEAISQAGVQFANKAFYKGDTQRLVDELWQNTLEKAERDLEQMGTNPLITSRTFQEYDKVYYDTYKAEKRKFKDDPTQSSLLKSVANKIFPSWFDDRKADLQLAVEEGENAINTQEENEKFGSLAAADYLAAQPKFNKKQAAEEVANRYKDILSMDEYRVLNARINDKPENQFITEDELVSMVVSTRILNPNNESKLAKEIKEAKLFYEGKYLSDNKINTLPTVGTPEYSAFSEGRNDYVNETVYNTDPDTIKKAKKLMRVISDLSINEDIREIAQIQLNQLGMSSVEEALIVDQINYFIDVDNADLIQRDIDNEKAFAIEEERTPKYTNKPTYLQYLIQEGKTLLGGLNLK